ncbi:S1 RNA-binding domain-containing protein [uncultured Eubacterium sp.]|uniref:S1 RNA-binding domain-containing protein n=1 Tax=uncultured Eubacterium sp. TaxID=165185 RepID=UPI0025D87794|nr:S1 RNA-binding domain-containing protein [uncultured Eubacterium sp.]
MGYVFISYSTKEQSSADAMKKLLEKQGIQTWMAPGDIPAGSRYAQVINKAVKECSCFILMLSENSQNSVWVAKEVERAINYRKPIIPVQLEDLVLNDEFELYISTDQVVAVQKIDENLPEVQKILTSAISIIEISENTIHNKQNVLSTDDSEGVLKLSKKLVDAFKGWKDIVAANKSGEVLEGTVVSVVKGGVIVVTKGTRVFVPASLTGVPRDQELDVLKGAVVKFKIIDINEQTHRAVGSIKVVQQEANWAILEEGKKLKGTVKSLTKYGAFVDIGGVDGFIHNSQISYKKIETPADVLHIGDEVYVKIIEIDFNNKRVSLSMKDLLKDAE